MNRSDTSQKTNLTNKLENDSSMSPNFHDSGIPSMKNHFEWMKKLPVFIFAIIVIMGLTTCQKDDDPESDNFCSAPLSIALQDESNNVTNAQIAYQNDRTVANCNAYKAAYEAYIDGLERYEQCTTLTAPARAQVEDHLENARRESASISCE
jgi:hypothetical protein